MKTLLAAITCMIVFASCEKSYTCTCVYPGATISTTKTTFKTTKKSEAEASCNNLNASVKANGGSCAL